MTAGPEPKPGASWSGTVLLVLEEIEG